MKCGLWLRIFTAYKKQILPPANLSHVAKIKYKWMFCLLPQALLGNLVLVSTTFLGLVAHYPLCISIKRSQRFSLQRNLCWKDWASRRLKRGATRSAHSSNSNY